MTRLRADLCLLLVAAIWGLAFVAQKSAMDHVGPFGFTGVRFVLSLIVIAPFVIREWKKSPPIDAATLLKALPVCVAFAGGVFVQQVGLLETSVTNAGFITGLYVFFTPFIAWLLFRHRPNAFIWPACLLTVAGLWFLNGGSLAALTNGDYLILFCAVLFAGHVALTGWFLSSVPRPLFLVFMQYITCVIIGFSGVLLGEGLTLQGIEGALIPILYGGLISGGIAYTLQAVAQQYTPPSDAAIIMSAESIFAAAAGVLLLSEHFNIDKLAGCGLILLAIFCVEAKNLLTKKPETLSAPSPE